MPVKMRLRREGKKKQPFYRVVVADVRSPRDGRYIEDIGYYQPLHEPSTISIDRERALYWLHNGVQPTSAVVNLLRIEGIWDEFRPQDPAARRHGEGGEPAAATAGPDARPPAATSTSEEVPQPVAEAPDEVRQQAREEVTQPRPGAPEEAGAIPEEQSP
ncbi:MAG: 30S ribosomal protein S16 [Actinomycetota bacterium]|nr:30S ribosomal protein S16 [Actinomycetota bacterium]